MGVQTIVGRVQLCFEDQGESWCDKGYVLSWLTMHNEDLESLLENLDLAYDEQVVVIPNVAANTTDLSSYQGSGGPLCNMINPTALEWKFVSDNNVQWRPIDSVDKVIDTDEGTGTGAPSTPVNTTTNAAVGATGSQTVGVVSTQFMSVGQSLTIDTGASQEVVLITALVASPPSFTAVFTMLHASGVAVIGQAPDTAVESNINGILSYEWRGGIIYISPSSVAVDLRVRFEALPAVVDTDNSAYIKGMTNCLVYGVAEMIAATRGGAGMPKLMAIFKQWKESAESVMFDRLVKNDQTTSRRMGGRRSTYPGPRWQLPLG